MGRAASAAPSVIFFDEIEALTPRRGADSTGVTDRVVNQMLCYLDGVEDRGRVYVVAATGRPDLVDPALMRPGRFDKISYCGMPTDEEKTEICEILGKKHGLEADSSMECTSVELRPRLRRLVARMPPRFTSADVGALFSSAKVEAVNEMIQRSSKDGGAGTAAKAPVITFAHLYSALACAKASVNEADERRYNQVFASYRPGGAVGGGLGGMGPLGG